MRISPADTVVLLVRDQVLANIRPWGFSHFYSKKTVKFIYDDKIPDSMPGKSFYYQKSFK